MEKNKKITGFKTPANYFEEFEAQLFSSIEKRAFPKSTGFKTPEHYFEDLEARVLLQLKTSEKPAKVIPLFSRKYFGYAAAIAACLIIGISIFNNKTESVTFETVQMASINNYIEEGNLNLDYYEITNLINDEDFARVNLEDQQFSDVVLKNYLLENIDAETLLYEP